MENTTVANEMEENEGNWYVIATLRNKEKRVKEDLEKKMRTMGIQDSLLEVFIAEAPVIGAQNKKKMCNLYPGYVYVKMKMTDRAWYVVRNTEGVTCFVGSTGKGTKPAPVPAEEMENVFRTIAEHTKSTELTVGDFVEIMSGPFHGKKGRIEALNDQTKTVRVLIETLGRNVPAEMSFPYVRLAKECVSA